MTCSARRPLHSPHHGASHPGSFLSAGDAHPQGWGGGSFNSCCTINGFSQPNLTGSFWVLSPHPAGETEAQRSTGAHRKGKGRPGNWHFQDSNLPSPHPRYASKAALSGGSSGSLLGFGNCVAGRAGRKTASPLFDYPPSPCRVQHRASHCTHRMSQLPVAAETDRHTLSGFKQHKLITSRFWRSEV